MNKTRLKQEGITIITPTGDRHEMFSLCAKWVSKQTVQPNQWIIVDDGKIPLCPPTMPFITYVRRVPKIDDPTHLTPICR